ncbi:MAG: DNA replication/repair protein RecF [Coriobacteriia bacterium]|nr:DNA replication/repair protein RecF [Coriobacteriia bacterium]
MVITRLEVKDFRNYHSFVVEPAAGLTVFVGPNAAGKTNIVEAVQLVTAAQSFRKPRFEDLVRWGSEGARIRLRAEKEPRMLETGLDVSADGKRTYTVNGQVRRRLSDVAGILPAVVFSPEDLALVKGPAERRRATIDDLGEQLSPTYGSLRRDYGKVVRHRNSLLRDGVSGAALDVWNEQLAALGSRLVVHRLRLLERVMVHVRQRYSLMAEGEQVEASYDDRCALTSCDQGDTDAVQEGIRVEIERRRAEEMRRATTLVGPHRDDIVFSISARDARSFASQGQQRTLALAWKLAEVEVVREVLHRDPVLLLDDVMSELDAERRGALSAMVSSDIQTMVTTTNTGYFTPEMLEEALVVPIQRERV